MQEPKHSDSEDLAQWLQETGRRRAPQPPSPAGETAQSPGSSVRSLSQRQRQLLLGACASLAYLQYFYADVFLQIAKLPSLTIFVSGP